VPLIIVQTINEIATNGIRSATGCFHNVDQTNPRAATTMAVEIVNQNWPILEIGYA
jgi:hypothetical protein